MWSIQILAMMTGMRGACLAVLLCVGVSRAAVSQSRTPSHPEMARLQDLVGAWDVDFETRAGPSDAFVALRTKSNITSSLNGAFLQEKLSLPTPSGRTIELVGVWGYDRFRSLYRFAWLDDTYGLFDVHEGNWQGDSLVVSNTRTRTTLLVGGQEVFGRMIWSQITGGGLSVESLASTDSGRTWFVQARARYRRSTAVDPLTASTRSMYEPVKANIVEAADAMPDEHFAFRPVPAVRTFAQLLAHIANAEFTICSAALGTANPHPTNLEETTWSPGDLRRLLRESFRVCDDAYARLTDASMASEMDFFGGRQSRHFALTYNIVHANEHYGNIVTYMRIKGLVPPSTARQNR